MGETPSMGLRWILVLEVLGFLPEMLALVLPDARSLSSLRARLFLYRELEEEMSSSELPEPEAEPPAWGEAAESSLSARSKPSSSKVRLNDEFDPGRSS